MPVPGPVVMLSVGPTRAVDVCSSGWLVGFGSTRPELELLWIVTVVTCPFELVDVVKAPDWDSSGSWELVGTMTVVTCPSELVNIVDMSDRDSLELVGTIIVVACPFEVVTTVETPVSGFWGLVPLVLVAWVTGFVDVGPFDVDSEAGNVGESPSDIFRLVEGPLLGIKEGIKSVFVSLSDLTLDVAKTLLLSVMVVG